MSAEVAGVAVRPTLPYGAWPSPIDARDLVTGSSQPIDVWAAGGRTWWSQTRPDQGGRQQIIRRDSDGAVQDPLPEDWSARTRVHEYGGAAWWIHDEVIFSVSWSDQRIYRAEPDRLPVPITPLPAVPAALRYADGQLTPDGAICICVRESHTDDEVRNEIVALSASAPTQGDPPAPVVLVAGPDFVAAPRISPDGTRLAWIQWQHPNMPWDSTELWVGDLVTEAGSRGLVQLTNPRQVAGTAQESLVQPEWGPDGSLYVVSDRSDWWNVYRATTLGPEAELVAVHPLTAEVGQPAWIFGQSRYLVGEATIWMTYSSAKGAHLVTVTGSSVRDDVLPFLALASLRLDGSRIVAIGTRATAGPVVIAIDGAHQQSGGNLTFTVLNEPAGSELAESAISVPQWIDFPSADGRTAHALLYLPTSAEVAPPAGEKPPLLVTVHGGPTAAASPAFKLATQYWTTRGFAVVDVDYGGSTGYGRPYRRLLDGAWGIVDVEDACAAATWLAEQGLVDPNRLAIRGQSAGGFTTLAALATRDVFAAGASHFGVADLSALAKETHKFELRYLDGLIGPWPEAAQIYAERSPLSQIEGFNRPLIVLQGAEDAVVPPSQAEAIVDALAAKHVPHAYLLFPGEQHGFRRAENIIRSLEAELSFYGQVFGFEPAGSVEPVEIAFADRLTSATRISP
ncbi:MAG TPA: prolyl oligopeptidase family serine peptidase [Kineosporiaceae bacterium]|nr:prolyl oligopeptidase family serine peptidase [Kineosporiaceae bacterium]